MWILFYFIRSLKFELSLKVFVKSVSMILIKNMYNLINEWIFLDFCEWLIEIWLVVRRNIDWMDLFLIL